MGGPVIRSRLARQVLNLSSMIYWLFTLSAEGRWAQEKVGSMLAKLQRRWSLKHLIPFVFVPTCAPLLYTFFGHSAACVLITRFPSCHIPISKVKASLKASFADSWSSHWLFLSYHTDWGICSLTFISACVWKILCPSKEISITRIGWMKCI